MTPGLDQNRPPAPRPLIIETECIAGINKSSKGSPALPAVRHLTFVPLDPRASSVPGSTISRNRVWPHQRHPAGRHRPAQGDEFAVNVENEERLRLANEGDDRHGPFPEDGDFAEGTRDLKGRTAGLVTTLVPRDLSRASRLCLPAGPSTTFAATGRTDGRKPQDDGAVDDHGKARAGLSRRDGPATACHQYLSKSFDRAPRKDHFLAIDEVDDSAYEVRREVSAELQKPCQRLGPSELPGRDSSPLDEAFTCQRGIPAPTDGEQIQ